MMTVTATGANIPKIFERIKEELLKDSTPLLDMVGKKVVLPSIEKNFEEEGRPKWQELAPRTQLERMADGFDPSHPILQRYGELRQSSTKPNEAGNIYDLGKRELVIKNILRKAADLHYGNSMSNLPARPFFCIPTEDLALLDKELANWAMKEIQKIAKIEVS